MPTVGAEALRRHLAVLDSEPPDASEARCNRCGDCCHVRVMAGGLAIGVRALPCQFLRQETDGKYSCAVYAERATKAPWCSPARTALVTGHLPNDCPYVDGLPGYSGIGIPDAATEAVLYPILRRRLRNAKPDPSVSPEVWDAFLAGNHVLSSANSMCTGDGKTAHRDACEQYRTSWQYNDQHLQSDSPQPKRKS